MQRVALDEDVMPAQDPTLVEAALHGTLRRWRAILLATVASGAIGVPIAMRMPSWFEAEVRMIPTPSRKASPFVGAMDPSGGAAPDDINVPGGIETAADLGRLLSILHSRTLTDETIARFGLQKIYQAPQIEDVRALFWSGLCAATLDHKEGYVLLSFEDRDPTRAAAVANFMARQANEVTRKITSAAASQERTFIELRLDEVRRQVDASSQAYRKFQQDNKLIDIDGQTNAVVQTMLHLKEQLISDQLELQRLRGYAGESEPSVIAAAKKVRDLGSTLSSLQSSDPAGAPDVFTRLDLVPELRLENERLLRDLKERTVVYEMLLREYEVAKLAEVRDTQSFELLDEAVVPTKKTRPSRMFSVLGIALLGFSLAAAAAAARGAWPVLRSYRV